MPEGSDVLYMTIFLQYLVGSNLINLTFVDKNNKSKMDLPKDNKITQVNCKGKVMWLMLGETNYLHIHNGLKGWLHNEEPTSNIKYILTMKSGNEEQKLFMEDPIRLSNISLHTNEEHEEIINKLGVDMFTPEFTPDYFYESFSKKKTLLASALLDQAIVSGPGNYVKNDCLYLTDLKVNIRTNQLTRQDYDRLFENVLYVAYSVLFTYLEKAKLMSKLDKTRKENLQYLKKQPLVPYVFQIYRRDKTDKGEEVFKIKVAGRDTYCTKEQMNK